MMTRMDYREWRAALQDLVSQGLRDHRAAKVAAALGAEVARVANEPTRPVTAGPPAPPTTEPGPPVLEVTTPVLGVDGCAEGWVGVCLRPDLPPTVLVGSSVAALLDLARTTGPVGVVAIDIPIGLPDSSGRRADALARQELPGKGPSVFTTLTRAAYQAETYAEAREANVAATGGASASAQAYALAPKILEVDAWVRARPGAVVIEVHPELSFARITGAPVLARKKDADGVAARREALAQVGLVAPPFYRGSGFAEDDLLDACAAAWSALRHAQGLSESFPAEPEVFADGLPAAIRV